MSEIKLYTSPLQGFFLFSIGLLFTIIGIFIILEQNYLLGISLVLLFGLCTLIGLFVILDKKPQIIIDKNGVWRRKAMWTKYSLDDVIEWNTLKHAYAHSVESNKFLCLVSKKKTIKKQNTFEKSVSQLNKEMGFQDININLGLVKTNENQLADFVNSMIYTDEEKREQLIQNFVVPMTKSFISKFKFW